MSMKRSNQPVNRRHSRRPVKPPVQAAPTTRVKRSSLRLRLQAYGDIHLQTARETLQRLVRLRHVSLLTSVVIGLTLALPAGLYVLADNVQTLLPDWRADAQLSVFFKPGTDLERARARLREWERRPELIRAELITPDDALAQMRQLPGFDAAIAALGENPLPPVVVLWPRLDRELQPLVAELQRVAEVDRVQLDREWLERLLALGVLVGRLARLVGILFAVAVLVVVGNTIRMEVQNRRSEIEIIKLVGGTDRFIQRPFLYAGIWYGLSGALLAWFIVQLSVWVMSGPVGRLAALYQSEAKLHGLDFGQFVFLILAGVGLGGMGAYWAVRRQIREIEPP
jgi:cell division transport system permease protein